jgi:ABC-2 type transport system ATP-binding protein
VKDTSRGSEREAVLRVEGLHKTYHIGFFRKKIEVLKGVSFVVRTGEVFGLLGPNGAGKTTTLKCALGLAFPTAGSVTLFGQPVREASARARLGYLPENPYVYQYLRPMEFLDLVGRLHGLGAAERRARAEALLARVGLGHAVDRPIGKFSKGMTQRIGLAQALLADPELLILDEPMSGLDPIGRKEVRDLIAEERARGKTIVITSHILADVERLCDHVAIVDRGRVVASGAISELLRPEVRRVEVELSGVAAAGRARLGARREAGAGLEVRAPAAGAALVVIEGEAAVPEVLRAALDGGATVVAVTPYRDTLEELFLRNAVKTSG